MLHHYVLLKCHLFLVDGFHLSGLHYLHTSHPMKLLLLVIAIIKFNSSAYGGAEFSPSIFFG